MTEPGTRDRIHDDIATLTSFPDRRVGSSGHAAARGWAIDRFHTMGLLPFSASGFDLPYRRRGMSFANVVGVVAPRDDPAFAWPPAEQPVVPPPWSSHAGDAAAALAATLPKPVVLGAHYDTVPGTPGADDNAASLAIVVEVARRLTRQPAGRPVVVAAFDAEEPPYFQSESMGSVRFVNDHIGRHVHAAIILDLVAHAVPVAPFQDLVGLMGAESHPAWAEVARTVAAGALPILTIPNALVPDMSDHRAFRLAGRPYLFVTCGQGPHYHGAGDTLEHLDLDKTTRVADLVETLVRMAATSAFDGAQPYDSSPLDYEIMRATLGPDVAALLGLHAPRDARPAFLNLLALMQGQR